jgi:type II secretory pathway component GspD/PulD (secretin)
VTNAAPAEPATPAPVSPAASTNAAPATPPPLPEGQVPAAPATSATPAAPVPAAPDLGATAEAEAEEVLPLVTFGSDVSIQTAIQTLARQAGLNLHLDPKNLPSTTGPDGKTTVASASVRWENVTARQALEELLDINGLMLSLGKTKIYRVIQKPSAEPRVTTVIQLKFANLTNMVTVVSNSYTGIKAMADLRTSRLVITGTEKDLESVSNLMAQLDLPTKQVLIEAQIFETTKNPNSIKGIDWSGTLEAQNVSFGNGNTAFTSQRDTPGGTTASSTPGGRPVSVTSEAATTTSALTQLLPAEGLIGFTANTARGFNPNVAFLNADGARAVLSFLNKETDSEVLATPRAVTMDNEPATLQVTRAYPIFKVTPGTSQTPAGSEIQYTNMGTILTVTPRISANSTVAMKVLPVVSSIDSKDRQTINGQLNEANVYAIRSMEANVLVKSGNTLVMGGLISDNRINTYSKVPLLGDIPGVGMAFRRQGKQRTKSNLVIFVTPTIVDDSDFQPAGGSFLKTRPPKPDESDPNAWDGGKPYDWLKKEK